MYFHDIRVMVGKMGGGRKTGTGRMLHWRKDPLPFRAILNSNTTLTTAYQLPTLLALCARSYEINEKKNIYLSIRLFQLIGFLGEIVSSALPLRDSGLCS